MNTFGRNFRLSLWGESHGSLLGITLASYMTDLVQMLPYVVTIVVLIVVSMRKKKENQPPAHLGLAYFREER